MTGRFHHSAGRWLEQWWWHGCSKCRPDDIDPPWRKTSDQSCAELVLPIVTPRTILWRLRDFTTLCSHERVLSPTHDK